MDTRTRAVIADDEPLLAADLVTRLGRLWPTLEIAAVVHNGPAAVEAVMRLQPDIAFLDIRMPGLTGLEVARKVQPPSLVFVTAYDQYAVDAFEQAAVDYLLKPVSDERLQHTVQRLQQRRAPLLSDVHALLQRLQPAAPPGFLRWIRASQGETVHLVDVQQVLFFQADDKYTVVMTSEREYLIRTPLRELLAQLDPQQFWQIHRSTVVNVQAIHSVQRELTGRCTLQLKQRPEKLTVSRAFAHLFRQM